MLSLPYTNSPTLKDGELRSRLTLLPWKDGELLTNPWSFVHADVFNIKNSEPRMIWHGVELGTVSTRSRIRTRGSEKILATRGW